MNRKWTMATAAGLWVVVGILINRPWISAFCGDVVSCWLLLHGLGLFMWLALGVTVALVVHYYRANRRNCR
jgi:hypothetical protein